MEYNGKYYYKIVWDCGFAGTQDYEIYESEEELNEKQLNEMAREAVIENCQREGWTEEQDMDDLIDAGFADEEDDNESSRGEEWIEQTRQQSYS